MVQLSFGGKVVRASTRREMHALRGPMDDGGTALKRLGGNACLYRWQLVGATNYYKRGGIMVVGNDKL